MRAGAPSRQQRGCYTEDGFGGGGRKVSGSSVVLVPAGGMRGHPCLTPMANRYELMKRPHF